MKYLLRKVERSCVANVRPTSYFWEANIEKTSLLILNMKLRSEGRKANACALPCRCIAVYFETSVSNGWTLHFLRPFMMFSDWWRHRLSDDKTSPMADSGLLYMRPSIHYRRTKYSVWNPIFENWFVPRASDIRTCNRTEQLLHSTFGNFLAYFTFHSLSYLQATIPLFTLSFLSTSRMIFNFTPASR